MDLRPTPANSIRRGPFAVIGFIIKCLSKSNLPRDPPSPRKTKHLRLITIAASHYCEKARWALDLLEADPESPYYYTEDGHTPATLAFETLPASGYKYSASPMVVYPDGTFEVKSDAILRRLCSFLYPKEIEDRVKAVEEDIAVRLGTSLRCVVYHLTLQKPYYDPLCELLSKNTSRIEGILLHAMIGRGVADAMKKLIHVNQATFDASLPVLLQTFAELSERLGDGREFLCDDGPASAEGKSYGFTAADLTLAALASPLLQPPSYYSAFDLSPERLPPELQALQAELRATRAGQHVLKMYETYRPTVNGAVVVKSGPGRDDVDWIRVMPVVAVAGASIAVAGAALVSLWRS
jgi:glutathione S-transferase